MDYLFEVWSGLLVFVQIVMVFGEVGHTHDRMDAMFGIFSQKLQHMDCLSPHDLRKIIMKYGKHNEMDNSSKVPALVSDYQGFCIKLSCVVLEVACYGHRVGRPSHAVQGPLTCASNVPGPVTCALEVTA